MLLLLLLLLLCCLWTPADTGCGPEQVVRNALLQHTGLQTRIHANMVSLVDGKPLQLGLKDMLARFLEFRRAVVQRRTQ